MRTFLCTEHWHMRSAFAALASQEGPFSTGLDGAYKKDARFKLSRGSVTVVFPSNLLMEVLGFCGIPLEWVKQHRFLMMDRVQRWIRESRDHVCVSQCDLCVADRVLGS